MSESRIDASPAPESASAPCPLPRTARRIGLVAFCFFLIKGLLWLLIPALVYWRSLL